jgi:hypothetical protein
MIGFVSDFVGAKETAKYFGFGIKPDSKEAAIRFKSRNIAWSALFVIYFTSLFPVGEIMDNLQFSKKTLGCHMFNITDECVVNSISTLPLVLLIMTIYTTIFAWAFLKLRGNSVLLTYISKELDKVSEWYLKLTEESY